MWQVFYIDTTEDSVGVDNNERSIFLIQAGIVVSFIINPSEDGSAFYFDFPVFRYDDIHTSEYSVNFEFSFIIMEFCLSEVDFRAAEDGADFTAFEVLGGDISFKTGEDIVVFDNIFVAGALVVEGFGETGFNFVIDDNIVFFCIEDKFFRFKVFGWYENADTDSDEDRREDQVIPSDGDDIEVSEQKKGSESNHKGCKEFGVVFTEEII